MENVPCTSISVKGHVIFIYPLNIIVPELWKELTSQEKWGVGSRKIIS